MEEIRFDGKLRYIINDIGFVNVLRNKDFRFNVKNGKNVYTISYVVNGNMNYFFYQTGKSLTVKEGELLFIPKHYPYNATYTADSTVIKGLTFDIISDSLPAIFTASFHKSGTAFADVFESLSGERLNSISYLASKIYELLYLLEKETSTVPDKFRKIIPAVNEIRRNFADNRKISYYADMCYMSESNFRKLFREYTGKSFIEYRNLIRISKARAMIDSGEFTVGEAAYATGFNNMSFFYEVLNKYVKK